MPFHVTSKNTRIITVRRRYRRNKYCTDNKDKFKAFDAYQILKIPDLEVEISFLGNCHSTFEDAGHFCVAKIHVIKNSFRAAVQRQAVKI